MDGQNGKNDSLVAVFRLVAFLFSVEIFVLHSYDSNIKIHV